MHIPPAVPTPPAATKIPLIIRLVIGIGGAFFALFIVTILGFALTGRYVVGSGTAKSESRHVAGFTRVALEGEGSLTIQQTGTESLTIEADDNIVSLISSDVRNGLLTLSTSNITPPFSFIFPRQPIHYVLTVKDLSDLTIAGSGSVTMDALATAHLAVGIFGSGSLSVQHLATTTLNATIAGSGDIRFAGQTQTQTIVIDGSGSYHGGNLASDQATIEVNGSGNVAVTVANALTVNIAGSGSVTYCGNPTLTQRVEGSGSIDHC